VQQVRREQHGATPVGEAAQQVPHPADASRVEAVGGLVEDQHVGVADQCGRDAATLAHAQRVVADPAAGLARCQADPVEHLVHAGRRDAHGPLGDGEDLPAGPSGVLGGGIEEYADLAARVGQLGERATPDGGAPGGGPGQARHHAHGRGLAGAVGTEEPGDPAGGGGEGDVRGGGEGAVPHGECFDFDHGSSLAAARASAHRGAHRPTPGPDPDLVSGSDPEARDRGQGTDGRLAAMIVSDVPQALA